MHAVDVLRRRLDAHQDDVLVPALERLGLVGREHDLSRCRAGRGGQPGRDDVALGIGIDGRMQKLVERGGVDAGDRLLAGDEPLARKLDRDLERRLGGALARTGLQHPQLVLLDREFEVLHVAVMALERAGDAHELLERQRHRGFHRRFVGAGFLARGLGDLLRRANARDHVLALGIDQKLAVEPLVAGRRIAREGDAGRRGRAHVAEHHGLDIDRRAPAFRDVVQAPIGDRALVHPGAEHRGYRPPQLLVRILRERLVVLLREPLLVALHERDPVIGRQIGVERVAVPVLVVVEDFLEVVVAEAEHHVGIHRDEATIGIVGEAWIARLARQRRDRLVVEAEVEHGVHHARHRRARARAHRDQERICAVAESLAGDTADLEQRGVDLRAQPIGITLVVGVELRADVSRDGEAGRHRQAEIGHLGEARALAAEEVAHAGPALGLAVAEAIDPFPLGRRLRGLARRGGTFAGRGRLGRRRSLAARRLARGRNASGFLFRSGTARRRFGHGITI